MASEDLGKDESASHEAELSWGDFIEFAYDAGWTDGFPVIPPLRSRVESMLRAAGPGVARTLGRVPPLMGEVTLERLAANAVMAGCEDAYFPVLIAAAQGVLDEGFNASAVEPTTNPVGPLVLVNGPVAQTLEINSGTGCMGPGFRANSTIGRALRLALINIGGSAPGPVDRATHGYPGKYTFCFAENESASPWAPFHVRRGFEPNESVVTVYQACGFLNLQDQSSSNAKELFQTLAGGMHPLGSNNLLGGGGPCLLILGPKHARILADGGFTVESLQEALFEKTMVYSADMPPAYRDYVLRRREAAPDAERVPIVRDPSQIEILVAGGPGNRSIFVPGFADGTAPSVKVQLTA